jgi:hypothetical protein
MPVLMPESSARQILVDHKGTIRFDTTVESAAERPWSVCKPSFGIAGPFAGRAAAERYTLQPYNDSEYYLAYCPAPVHRTVEGCTGCPPLYEEGDENA